MGDGSRLPAFLDEQKEIRIEEPGKSVILIRDFEPIFQ
jgi:hypothetical protein